MVNGYTGARQQTLLPPPYRYLIDTCSILSQKPDEPHRRNVYGSMWTKIDELIENKAIVTCSEVKSEVEDDDMQHWLAEHGCVVLGIDDDIQRNVTKIVTEHPSLIDIKNAKSSGDAFLIATAMKYSLAIITEENKNSTKKIPMICKAYDIPCFNITELAEKEKWVF
jgi:hypothetical protein